MAATAAALLQLPLDLRPPLDGLLAGVDLRLAPDRLGLAMGDLDTGAAAPDEERRGEHCPDGEPSERGDDCEQGRPCLQEEVSVYREIVPRLLTSGARPARPAPALGASDQRNAGVSFAWPGT